MKKILLSTIMSITACTYGSGTPMDGNPNEDDEDWTDFAMENSSKALRKDFKAAIKAAKKVARPSTKLVKKPVHGVVKVFKNLKRG